MEKKIKHYFEVLGLKEGASQKDIQIAYKNLSEQFDPENNDNHDFFNEEYKKVKQAYKVLSDRSLLKNSNITPNSNNSQNNSQSTSSTTFSVTFNPEKIQDLNKDFDIQNKTPDGLKITSILSMIGSSFWILIFFVYAFDSLGVSSLFAFIFLFFGIIIIAKFLGAWKMYKLKKNGFIIYSVSNIIYSAMIFFSILSGDQENNEFYASVMLILFCIFLIIFYKYKKHLIN